MGNCFDCNEPYSSARFPDLLIETWAWKRISPTFDENGLLCPNCIVARLDIAGIRCLSCFTSGPLAAREDAPWMIKERLRRLEDHVSRSTDGETEKT